MSHSFRNPIAALGAVFALASAPLHATPVLGQDFSMKSVVDYGDAAPVAVFDRAQGQGQLRLLARFRLRLLRSIRVVAAPRGLQHGPCRTGGQAR